MTDFEYMEKYGDEGYDLNISQHEEEQEKIDKEETIKEIKKLLEEMQRLVEEL